MERTRDVAFASASAIFARLFETTPFPATVVDFGCGRGDWLRAARAKGAREALGLEGSAGSAPAERDVGFVRVHHDLTTLWRPDRPRDLALCVEVAEHLAPSAAKTLVTSISSAAPWCIFSAAIPLQGGVQHLNEQEPGYWAALFAEQGMECLDPRMRLWDDPTIAPWYRQNLLLFRRPGSGLREWDSTASVRPPYLVHPEVFAAYGGSRSAQVIWEPEGGRWVAHRFAKGRGTKSRPR